MLFGQLKNHEYFFVPESECYRGLKFKFLPTVTRTSLRQAGAGLAGLRNVSADEEADKATVRRCQESFAAYDDLVKAKCIIDLVTELPSYEEELGEQLLIPVQMTRRIRDIPRLGVYM